MKYLILALLLLSTSVFSSEAIRSYLISPTEKNLNQIASEFEIVRKTNQGFEVYVLENKVKNFLKLTKKPKLLEKNIHAVFQNKSLFGYKGHMDVEITLKDFANKYPQFLKLETYGTSKEGRQLYALRLETNAKVNKSEIFITAATHGDELMPVEVLLKIMDESFAKYGTDNRITKMFDEKIIYFIPVVSPDSFDARSRYVEGDDPNRAYPWPEKINNKSVSVISSLINFFHKHNFKASMDLHAYGRMIMYPWGYTKHPPATTEEVSTLSDIVSSMARENEYEHGQISTTIYVAKGNSADYYYWKNKTRAIAVEIGDQKIPPFANLSRYVDESREMFYRFMEYQY